MIRYIGLVVFFSLSLSLSDPCWAQGSPPGHIHPDVTVVDGAKNPELIPDSAAYRMWLLMVSLPPDSTAKQQAVQRAHLRRLAISEGDASRLLSILSEFRTRYSALITQHNENERAALRGVVRPVDEPAFLKARDDLVLATRSAIAQTLSQDAASRVDAFIQGEKRRMQIHTTGGSQ